MGHSVVIIYKKSRILQVAMIMGVAGGCRGEELCRMKLDDMKDEDDAVIVTVPDPTTDLARTFSIIDKEEDNIRWLQLFRKYVELRPYATENRRFFVRYHAGRCFNQVVGKNTFGKMPRLIAKYLKLEEPAAYTGHAFKRSYRALLENTRLDIFGMTRQRGWIPSLMAGENREHSQHNNKDGDKTKLLNIIVNQPASSANKWATNVRRNETKPKYACNEQIFAVLGRRCCS